MEDTTKDAIVAAIRRAAADAARAAPPGRPEPIALHRFCRCFGISKRVIYRHFPGGWHTALSAAGFTPRRRHGPITESDLLARYARPRDTGFQHVTPALGAPLVINTGRPTQPLLDALAPLDPDALPDLASQSSVAPMQPLPSAPDPTPPDSITRSPAHPAGYGHPLTTCPLLLAPTNELGVLFLFGLLAPQLGFAVLRIHPSFPDCEALRRATHPDAPRGRWERLRIEFEFRSSNFARHAHDPAACDLIICWDHDWPACPLEVLELRPYIDRLSPLQRAG